MEEHNIIDLVSIDNMNIFSQHSGICWLVSSIAMLFFDDNNKLITYRLFNWAKRGDKIIPVSSIYRNKSPNKNLDLLMYLILEVIRINIKKSILREYTKSTSESCDMAFVNLFRDFFLVLSSHGEDCSDPVKISHVSDGGSNNGFICFFCKYYNIEYHVDKSIRLSDEIYNRSYIVRQLTYSSKEGNVVTSNYHTTSIISHKNNFYYFDGNLLNLDRFHLNKTKINSSSKLSYKDFFVKCNEVYGSKSLSIGKFSTIAYHFYEDLNKEKFSMRKYINNISSQTDVLSNLKKLNKLHSIDLFSILKKSFKKYFDCFKYSYEEQSRDRDRLVERRRFEYGEPEEDDKDDEEEDEEEDDEIKKPKLPRDLYHFNRILYESKMYVDILVTFTRNLFINNREIWNTFIRIHRKEYEKYFSEEERREMNNKLKLYFFNYLFLGYKYMSVDEIMLTDFEEEVEINIKDYPSPKKYKKLKEKKREFERREFERRDYIRDMGYYDEFEDEHKPKKTPRAKKEFSGLSILHIPEYFSFIMLEHDRIEFINIDNKILLNTFFKHLINFCEKYSLKIKFNLDACEKYDSGIIYFCKNYVENFLVNLEKIKPKLPMEKFIDNLEIKLYVVETSNVPPYLKYEGLDINKICVNESCTEAEEMSYRKSILDTYKTGYTLSYDEIISRYISIFR